MALQSSLPLYDLVTTWAYMPADPMALTLDGSTRWPDRKEPDPVGADTTDLSEKKAEEHMEFTADAMASVAPQVREYFASRAGRDRNTHARCLGSGH